MLGMLIMVILVGMGENKWQNVFLPLYLIAMGGTSIIIGPFKWNG
jgi:hypothetical protein